MWVEVPFQKQKRRESTKVRQEKCEKNIRRRVYDALNVFISAGIMYKKKKVNIDIGYLLR